MLHSPPPEIRIRMLADLRLGSWEGIVLLRQGTRNKKAEIHGPPRLCTKAAQRNASPQVTRNNLEESTESAKYQRHLLRSFRASRSFARSYQGRLPAHQFP